MPKLSVVVPVYNVEKYLRKCLDSVIDESANDYEIIIVNDGSTDSSPSICREYAERYPTLIRFISTPNGGLGAARNVGIENACGEYLFFIDSDDYLAENAVGEMLELINQNHADFYLFDLVSVTEDGRKIGYLKGFDTASCFKFEEHPELLFYPPNACNKIWKTSFFKDNGIRFPGRVWFEDLYTIPKLYPHAETIEYVERPWYQYLYRTGSITQTKNPSRCVEIIAAVDSVLDYYKANGFYHKYSEQLEYMALYHQVITSTTRVNLIDRKSDIQLELYENYIEKFPNYRNNPYVRSMPKKLKLLMFYIEHKMYLAFNLTMRLNDRIKGKK